MKKTLICLTVLLLLLSLFSGCGAKSNTEETVPVTIETADTASAEADTRENWGAPFSADGTKEQIAYQFIGSVFPETWKSLFSCDQRLVVTKWGIRDGSEDDRIDVYLTFAVKAVDPTDADTALLTEGNYQAGKDDFEGYVILTRYCYLQKQADGSWQCVGFDLAW